MTDIAPTKPSFTLNGWHVLAMVTAFFLVVIGVDTIMIVKAYSTFSGEVAKNPYEAGLAYNKTLAQRRAEAALGWTVTVSEPADRTILLKVVDRDGKALDGLSVTGALERPATETGKLAVTFTPLGGGLYRAGPIAAGGAWDLSAQARDKAGHLMEAGKRFVWP